MNTVFRNTCIISRKHGDDTQFFVQVDNTVPQIETAPHYWQDCASVNQAIKQHYGLDVVTVRCLQVDFDASPRHYVYHMVWHDGDTTTGHWLTADKMPDNAHHWAQQALTTHPTQPAWYHPDWSQTLYDTFPDASLTQIRSWERSTVWRIEHNQQTHYIKAVPDMFRHELPLTQWLADQFPQTVIRPERELENAMLTPAYEGTPLGKSHTQAIWESALTTYAQLQIETLQHTDDLIVLGVPQRDMTWLKHHADQLLQDSDAIRQGDMRLSEEEINSLNAVCSTLEAYFDVLDGVLALEHGDLHNAQIFVSDDNTITLTDFSDSALTHPFFSLDFFLWDIAGGLSKDDLTEAYLKPFYAVWSREHCQKMLHSANKLSPLYSAVRYYVDILPNMTHRWEMENMLPFYLRNVILK